MNRKQTVLKRLYTRKTEAGVGTVSAEGCVHCYVPELIVSGGAVRNTAPTPAAPVSPLFCEGCAVESRGGNLSPQKAYSTNATTHTTFVRGFYASGMEGTLKGSNYYSSGWAWAYYETPLTIKSGETLTLSFDLEVLEDHATGPARVILDTGEETAPTMLYSLGTGGHRVLTAVPEEDAEVQRIVFSLNSSTLRVSRIHLQRGALCGEPVEVPLLRANADGSCRDTWSLTTGRITRRIQELVLDGTEGWEPVDGLAGVQRYRLRSVAGTALNQAPLCSHYVFCNSDLQDTEHFFVGADGVRFFSTETSVAAFKAFLAEQYAAGTPVTLWYATAGEGKSEQGPKAKLIQQKGITELTQVGGAIEEVPLTATFLRRGNHGG